MNVIGVIPARYGSTRFPGKPLAEIAGKPLLQWVIEGARSSQLVKQVIVATDDARIAALGERVGVRVAMTKSDLPTGTDRVWAALQSEEYDVAINIQGDEPLITGQLLDQLVLPFKTDASLEMSTLARKLSHDDLMSPNTAKIVVNSRSEALYFSRLPIPYSRRPFDAISPVSLKHIGLYAYSREFLRDFCAQPPTALEVSESLEQLRALYLGARIKVVEVEHDSWGVDVPEDVAKIEKLLKKMNRA